jgi:sterol 3beta-glucosyltransferase
MQSHTINQSYSPPENLKRFLEHEQKPIFVGFGSMVMKNKEKYCRMIVSAAVQSKQRVILQSGWADYAKRELPECVIMITKVPHSWLFEQVAAVVHHGGHGTTMTGLYCGKPTGIIPFFGDQHFRAQVVEKQKVGKVGIRIPSIHKLTVTNLEKSLQTTSRFYRYETKYKEIEYEDQIRKTPLSRFIELFNLHFE